MDGSPENLGTRTWEWNQGLGRTFISLGILATATLLGPGFIASIRLGASLDPQEAWETGAAISPALSVIGSLLMMATAITSFVVTKRLNRDERPNRKPIFWILALVVVAQAISLIARNVLGW